MNVTLKGTPHHASKEFFRAWVHATLCVLAFHNRPLRRPITITLRALLESDGLWHPDGNIEIRHALSAETLATTIVHELIHECCGDFGEDTDEKCTSTLTARLKPLIQPIAEQLIENTYRGAAFMAHTKLSYRTDEDHYDQDQDKPIGVRDRRKKTA